MIHIKNKPRQILEVYSIDFERTLCGDLRPCLVFAWDKDGNKCCVLFQDIDGDPEEIRQLVEKHKEALLSKEKSIDSSRFPG